MVQVFSVSASVAPGTYTNNQKPASLRGHKNTNHRRYKSTAPPSAHRSNSSCSMTGITSPTAVNRQRCRPQPRALQLPARKQVIAIGRPMPRKTLRPVPDLRHKSTSTCFIHAARTNHQQNDPRRFSARDRKSPSLCLLACPDALPGHKSLPDKQPESR